MRRNTNLILILLPVVTLIIITLIIVLYFVTDLFKSNETLYKKYCLQGVSNIKEVLNLSEENEYIKLLEDNDYSQKTEITLNYLEAENDEQEVYNISTDGATKHEDNSSYRRINVDYKGKKLLKVNLLKQDNMYGLKLANLVKQFVSLDNKNLSYVVSSMELEGKYFSENISTVKLQDLLEFTDEELAKLEETYVNLFFSNIKKTDYSSKNNVIITLANGESPTTKSYTLTLTKNEMDNINKRIMNQLIQDEIIISKLDKIDERIKEAGFVEPEGESLKEKYIEKIKTILESIEYEGQNESKYIYTVYQLDKNIVRISLKTDQYEITIDFDNTDGQNVVFKKVDNTEEGENLNQVTIAQKLEDGKLTRTLAYEGTNQSLAVQVDLSKLNNTIKMKTKCNYSSDSIKELDVNCNKEIDLVSVEKYPINFTKNNNIVLNNYEAEEIKGVLNALKEKTINSLKENQAKINTKMLSKIIDWIENREEQKVLEEQNSLDAQKKSFNNKFELYVGEDLELEHINKLLKVVSKNIASYSVKNGSTIEIAIEEGKENEKKVQEISTALTDDKTYNVKMNYGEDGYINTIEISVFKEE